MTKVIYAVTSPLKRDGRRVPVGGTVTLDSDDEEIIELVEMGLIDPASAEFVTAPSFTVSQDVGGGLPGNSQSVQPKSKRERGPVSATGKADGAGATGGAS